MENIYSYSKSKQSILIGMFILFFSKKNNVRLKLIYTFLLLMVVQTCVFSQTNSWQGSLGNSDWETGSNWSLSHKPTALEDVVIPAFLLATKPTISVAGAVCKTLLIQNNGLLTNNALTINSPGTLVTGAISIAAPNGLLTYSTTIAVGSGSLTASSITMTGSDSTGGNCVLSISSGTINISGNLVMNGASPKKQVIFSGAGTLNIGGTMTGGGLTPSTGTVVYNGNSTQILGIYDYYKLTISNTSGGVTIGSGNVNISNTLTMTSGILTTSSANLINITNTASTGVAGGTPTSFVNGPLKWTLPANLVSGSTYKFPVGKGGIYLPFSLVNPTTGTGAVTAQAEAFNVNSGGVANFTTIGSLSSSEYWSLVTTGNFSNSALTLSRPTAVTPLDVIGGSTAVAGTYTSLAGTAAGASITNSSAIGTNIFFVLGRTNAIRTGTVAGSPFCAGSVISIPYTIAGTYTGANVFTAQLSNASGSFASPVNIGSVTQTTAGTITATIPSNSLSGTGYRIQVVSSLPNVVGVDNGINLTIRNSPTIAAISSLTPLCPLATINPAVPAVTANGSSITVSGWELETAVGSGLFSGITVPYAVTYADNGKNIRYMATNGCGTATSNTVVLNVNPAPTLLSAVQTIFACNNTATTIKLTGLLAGTTFTVNYSINGNAETPITNLTEVAGEATFTTRNLTTADDGKTLEITGITITSAMPACTKSFAGVSGIDVLLNVKSNSGPITLTPGSTINSGGVATSSELTEVVFSIAPIAGATSYFWVISPDWTIVSTDVTTNSITVKTGTRFQGNNVQVTASNMVCPSSVMVDLSPIAPQAPIKNTATDVSCKVLGSVELTNLPVGDWHLTMFKDGGVGVPDISRIGSTFTVDNLTAGSYTFTVTDDYGTSVESNPIIISGLTTNTWNGTWSKGSDPVINDNVVFDADFDKLGSINACSCKINSGATVTINSGDVMIVENELDVDGTLIFENGASLVQVNDGALNDGIITYKRSSTLLKDYDYVYWCSPLEGQTLGGVVPGNNKAWSYELGNWWAAAGVMLPAKGYIVRYSNADYQNAAFVGKPNNGDYSIALQATGSNLIGNPYPSAIDAKKFMTANGTGSLYFWTHNTSREINGDGTKYIYSSNDYASFNGTGGVQAVSGGAVPDGTIAAGQSFFVATGSGSDFKFTNSMRIGIPGSNNLFFKQSNAKKDINNDMNRVWLNLTNDCGAFKQLLVGYVTGATNDFDYSYDGITLNGNAHVDFYSIGNSKNYTIQGRGLPFDPADEVPLGYSTNIEGTFKISINNVDGVLTNQPIYLKDKTANTVFDLTKGSYSFTTAKGEFQDRFVLLYKYSSLGTEYNNAIEKGVVVSEKNNQIKINSFDENISSVKIYDLKGSLLFEKKNIEDNECTIKDLVSGNQVLIVLTQLENGRKFSNKMVYQD